MTPRLQLIKNQEITIKKEREENHDNLMSCNHTAHVSN